jgi:hypothetical protein
MQLPEKEYSGPGLQICPVTVQADTAASVDSLAIQTRIQGIAQAIAK